MTPEANTAPTDELAQRSEPPSYFVWLGVLALVYLLLVGVATIGAGFKSLSGGAEGAAAIFEFASSPIVGVVLGTLATALIQSSSTVSSVIVGLVAGGVPVGIAVPMIMGANMGTTITNTIVSLGNIRERGAFGRSFEAATVHDFFNLYSIAVLLPIEVLIHPLERTGAFLAEALVGRGGGSMGGFNPIGEVTRLPSQALIGLTEELPPVMGSILAIGAGIAMIVASVFYLGNLLRALMTGRARGIIDTAIGRGPMAGIGSGTIVTVLVQSSSTTTSLVVPLAGAGILTTRQIYPFTLGANIGTCITALIAATAITGGNEFFALQIALVHLLYNLTGVALFMSIPFLRALPVYSAQWLGQRVAVNRGWAFAYVGTLFFVIPGVVFGAKALLADPQTSPCEPTDSRMTVCSSISPGGSAAFT